jgi:hypothetical protein
VAYSFDDCATSIRIIDHCWRSLLNCAISLYFLLMKKTRELEPMLLLTVLFAVLYYYTERDLFFILSVIIGITGLLFVKITEIIIEYWEKGAKIIGTITTFILLSLTYVLLFTTMSLIGRLIRRAKNLNRKNIKVKNSNYIYRNHTFSRDDMELSF